MCNVEKDVKGNYFNLSIVENKRWFHDFKIVFEDDGFSWSSNRILFAEKNRYFRDKLDNDDTIVIKNGHLVQFKKSTMELLTKYYMYGNADLKEDILESVLRFCELIDEQGLLKLCVIHMTNNVNERNFAKIWSLASTFKIETLKKQSRNFALRYFKKIYNGMHFLEMENGFMEEILQSQKLNTDNEEMVFFFLQKWLEFDTVNRESYIESFIKLIRIMKLSDQFKTNHLEPFYRKFKIDYHQSSIELTEDSFRDNVLTIEQIAENFQQIVDKNEYLDLSHDELSHVIKSNRNNKIEQKSLYSYLEKWMENDFEYRRSYFSHLLKEIDWNELSLEFIAEKIDKCQLYNVDIELWNVFKNSLKKIINMNDQDVLNIKRYEKSLLVIGGYLSGVGGKIEVFNENENKWEDFFELPMKIHDYKYVMLEENLLIIGGYFGNEVYSLNFETKKIIQLPKMNVKRNYFSANVIDGSVYVCGGYHNKSLKSVEMWTTGWVNWKNCQPMSFERDDHAAVHWKNRLYVFGGENSGTNILDSVEYYDLKNDKWHEVTQMKTPSKKLTAVVLNDLIYVMGGLNHDKVLNTVDVYDPHDDFWMFSFDLPEPLDSLSSATMYGKIFISGGENAEGDKIDTVHEFDPKTYKWRTHSALINLRSDHAMLTVTDALVHSYNAKDSEKAHNTLLVVGGFQANGNIEVYNEIKNKWEVFFKLPVENSRSVSVMLKNNLLIFGGCFGDDGFSLNLETKKIVQLPKMNETKCCFSVTVIDGSVCVCGGYYENSLKTVEMLSPEWENWKKCRPMSHERYNHAAVQWKNVLYVFGGMTDDNNTLDSVEYYDPKKDEWNKVTPMKTPSSFLTAVVLNDLIYVMGGRNESDRLNSVNVYDAQSDSWTASFNLPEPLSSLSSTIMYDKIYVSGGRNADSDEINKVYEFDPKCGIWKTHSELIDARYYHSMFTVSDSMVQPNT